MSGEQAHPPQASAAKPERHQLFISYSHKDREWVERLRTMIKPLERRHGLDRWDDSRIQAGMVWREEIEKALASARVALLLVSADFLASDFVTREELPDLFHAARQEGLRILWVPLRPCLWKLIPEIEQYQAAIPPGRTLAQMAEVEQELAMVQIARSIQQVFQEEAERLAREQKAEAERLAGEKEALERRAEQERMAREEAERRGQEAELQAHQQKREQEEAEQRQARERDERKALAEAERWKAEAERLARDNEALERKAEEERSARELLQREKPDRSPAPPQPQPSPAPPPLRLQVLAGSLVQDGTGFWGQPKWRVETRPLQVEGYREELAEGVALAMVKIPAGTFLMGSPPNEPERLDDEGPLHEVSLGMFFLAQTPITQAQWVVVAGWEQAERDLNPDPSKFKGANRPVERVNWHDATEFCRRLSQRTGKRYGLPSEAQWEYSCRAGTTTPFHFGATLTPELANYNGTSTYGKGPKGTYREQTTDVASFPANGWGLHDLHGNVWEWCEDHWHASYDFAPGDDQPWLIPAAGPVKSRLLRGGSWYVDPRSCRSACRYSDLPGYRYGLIGFRVCCLPPGSAA